LLGVGHRFAKETATFPKEMSASKRELQGTVEIAVKDPSSSAFTCSTPV
jgi:hypothetical protein